MVCTNTCAAPGVWVCGLMGVVRPAGLAVRACLVSIHAGHCSGQLAFACSYVGEPCCRWWCVQAVHSCWRAALCHVGNEPLASSVARCLTADVPDAGLACAARLQRCSVPHQLQLVRCVSVVWGGMGGDSQLMLPCVQPEVADSVACNAGAVAAMAVCAAFVVLWQ
jgi:hypothetical protein